MDLRGFVGANLRSRCRIVLSLGLQQTFTYENSRVHDGAFQSLGRRSWARVGRSDVLAHLFEYQQQLWILGEIRCRRRWCVADRLTCGETILASELRLLDGGGGTGNVECGSCHCGGSHLILLRLMLLFGGELLWTWDLSEWDRIGCQQERLLS